jgi:hypothetical protein
MVGMVVSPGLTGGYHHSSVVGCESAWKESFVGINFDDLKNKAAGLVEKHGDKIEQGAEKAGEFAKKKFGHDEQVDKVVGKISDAIPNKPDNSSDR